MAGERKRRPEAWFKKLASDDQREMVFQHGESHSLEATVAWIKAEFDIQTNRDSLSLWLEEERRRRLQDGLMALRLERLESANSCASQVSHYLGQTLQLHEANIALLSQSLLDAQINNDERARKDLAAQLAGMIDALAKKQRAAAAAQDSDTARRKYQRDTCRLFLKWHDDEEAKKILASGGTNEQKIDALGRAMFGEDWDEE